jgi:hypothetical protein
MGRTLPEDDIMTLAEAKALVRPLGFTLTRRDAEYRLAPVDGTPASREAAAYYTNDIEDAIGTAQFAATVTAYQASPSGDEAVGQYAMRVSGGIA